MKKPEPGSPRIFLFLQLIEWEMIADNILLHHYSSSGACLIHRCDHDGNETRKYNQYFRDQYRVLTYYLIKYYRYRPYRKEVLFFQPQPNMQIPNQFVNLSEKDCYHKQP